MDAPVPLEVIGVEEREADSGAVGSRDGDDVRQRELYKYFKPPTEAEIGITSCSRFASPDSVLTAHVQLAAWRLDCQRAMLSLIDKDTQYFIAESTKTLDIGGSGESEVEGDTLWLDLACTAVPKAGRLCEYTIAQPQPVEGGPAYFEVTDLSQDDRFSSLPFVAGPPGFRYYCGVPLRTEKGINIGSIFVMDNKKRDPASIAQREVLAAMAQNCMVHLKMVREKQAKQRALKMNMCLGAFVDPDLQDTSKRKPHSKKRPMGQGPSPPKTNSRAEPHSAFKPSGQGETTIRAGSKSSTSTFSRKSERRQSADDSSASDSDDDRATQQVGEHEQLNTYQRAADLMKESLTLDGGGGVVFLAPSQAYKLNPAEDETSSSDDAVESRPSPGRRNSAGHHTVRSTSSWGVRAQRKSIGTDSKVSDPADVLASSCCVPDSGDEALSSTGAGFIPLSSSDMQKLVKRHPRGKLFLFDGENIASSSSDEQASILDRALRQSERIRATRGEIQILAKHFPGARQIIFVPLWDSTTSRWCACFTYNTCEFRYLQSPDFLHSVAFGNCIMTEISRMATMTADQQKSDFIGSVSHELRSPLHGILASCEFLSETECDSFQKSLVDTADACARTLLDTLNMVLDYSKINHFERNLNKARKSRKDATTAVIAGQTPGLSPLLNIYGNVDLAVITEEVVEGVASGQSFRDALNNVDTADLPSAAPLSKRRSSASRSTPKPPVEIILDISARDWTFVTQPGAFRRIVMNLFGNSLKYTQSGFIRVKLETKDTPATPDAGGKTSSHATLIVLIITDSGSGMSAEFMRTKLFTPFSQESPMNPGTGLGLSLVRSIVNMLGGDINIQSAKNVGTEVRVTLPMLKGSPNGTAASTTPSSSGSSIERVKDESLGIVQRGSKGRSVALFSQSHDELSDSEKHAEQMLSLATRHYLEGWFQFEIRHWLPDIPTDIVLCTDSDLEALTRRDPSLFAEKSRSAILVLCTTASRHAARLTVEDLDNAEVLSHPFGPYKLAKSLRICLERLGRMTPLTAMEQPSTAAAERALSPVEEVTSAVQHVHLKEGRDTPTPGLAVMQQGETLGNEDSVGAQMALDSLPSKSSSGDSSEPKSEFPFPKAELAEDGTTSPSNLGGSSTPSGGHLRPLLAERRTISTTKREMSQLESVHISTPMSRVGAITDNPSKPPPATLKEDAKSSRPPRLLLVDDNPVNLRLLATFMRKRKYDSVSLAEDGSQAVAAFTSMMTSDPPAPPDIIFMDISMPIMDGFQATRRIREVEAEAKEKLSPMETPASALIIALTGLASGRDQSEAFTSGFDLYLTKPVSMREVGRLLSNWEANGGAATVGVPHGPLTGD